MWRWCHHAEVKVNRFGVQTTIWGLWFACHFSVQSVHASSCFAWCIVSASPHFPAWVGGRPAGMVTRHGGRGPRRAAAPRAASSCARAAAAVPAATAGGALGTLGLRAWWNQRPPAGSAAGTSNPDQLALAELMGDSMCLLHKPALLGTWSTPRMMC